MSVKIRPYRRGGWEVDITTRLPNGKRHRERVKAPVNSKSGATRWGEDRERHLLQHGLPEPKKEVPTLNDFAPRFVEDYAKANRQKPSGVASKATILRVHLLPILGEMRLDAIKSSDVQRLKAALGGRSAKTVNNVLTVLSVLLKRAVDWEVIERVPCTIKLLRVSRAPASFHDVDEYGRLLEAARSIGWRTHLIVLFGGDAGLRAGEIVALEWRDVDLVTRRVCVKQSDWKGELTAPKNGRIRYVPLTDRLHEALKAYRHGRSTRVLCKDDGTPLTRQGAWSHVRYAARRGNVRTGVHILRHTFCSHLAMNGAPLVAIQRLAGHQDLAMTQRYMHVSDDALDRAISVLNRATKLDSEPQSLGDRMETARCEAVN